MKTNRLIAALAFMLALTFSTAFAQTRPAAPASTPAQTSASIPESKIALIYSDAFLDPKTGIARFNALLTTLNREFQPRQTELQTMQQRITTLTNEVNQAQAASSVVDPKSIQAKIDTLDQLKKDLQRKGEDAQAAYTKRRQDIFQPLQDDIGKALGLSETALDRVAKFLSSYENVRPDMLEQLGLDMSGGLHEHLRMQPDHGQGIGGKVPKVEVGDLGLV